MNIGFQSEVFKGHGEIFLYKYQRDIAKCEHPNAEATFHLQTMFTAHCFHARTIHNSISKNKK